MSKVDCKDCHFYHNGRCEELGEYTTPGECECSWFAPKAIKKTCVAEIAKNAKQTVFNRIAQSPEVLAPQFVYHVTSFLDGLDKPKKIWYSTLIQGRAFASETEAKRATVARLKEVENG